MAAGVDLNLVIAFVFGLFLLYLLVRVLYLPLRIFLKLLGNALVGGILLAIFNAIGSLWGLTIGINILTAFVTGILGIPGIILLLILQKITS
ncbi:MAG TPA: pro-sigmaK processing inhibitor BofA [Firmicutes bacterium]|jgi:inhibitor of the pro-sigma K processing machinery|nr:pro-sigmaK processing inhibitor BofA [Bacillota bacterium]